MRKIKKFFLVVTIFSAVSVATFSAHANPDSVTNTVSK